MKMMIYPSSPTAPEQEEAERREIAADYLRRNPGAAGPFTVLRDGQAWDGPVWDLMWGHH